MCGTLAGDEECSDHSAMQSFVVCGRRVEMRDGLGVLLVFEWGGGVEERGGAQG
jgi:hypothetical protein